MPAATGCWSSTAARQTCSSGRHWTPHWTVRSPSTFVDPDAALSDEELQEILDRTLRLSRIDSPGVARILDVANTGSGGLVVSEWIRGGSLQEVAETSPSPIGGARAMQTLAAAAEAAHRAGVSLSIDHPSRIRVSIEGDVALAFPATTPDATPEDDIRGIGAALYALLINRWPLPESGVRSGLEPAEVDAVGQPVEPRAVDRDIPFQISAAAARSVQAGGGIRSAPTLLNLLQQATAIADRTERIPPVDEPEAPPRPALVRGDAPYDPEALARRRKGLIVGLSVAGAIIIVALIVLASVLSRIFGDVGGFSKDELGLNAPGTSAEGGGDGGGSGSGSTIKPVKATVFSPEGEADAPELAGLAIDGNSSTVWPIDTYTDPVPFPNFKNGVGLMLQLPQPTRLGEVTINLNSTGTAVEIRSSQTPTPSSLDATTVLTPASTLKPGSNTIKVDNASPTSNVLVWVSTLGHRQRREPLRHRRDHAQSRRLTATPKASIPKAPMGSRSRFRSGELCQVEGSCPSCCMTENRFATPQWSVIFPSRTRMASTVSNWMTLPVGATPRNSPRWVPW